MQKEDFEKARAESLLDCLGESHKMLNNVWYWVQHGLSETAVAALKSDPSMVKWRRHFDVFERRGKTPYYG